MAASCRDLTQHIDWRIEVLSLGRTIGRQEGGKFVPRPCHMASSRPFQTKGGSALFNMKTMVGEL